MPDGYRVVIRPSAARELESLPDAIRRRAADAIKSLSDEPRPRGCRKLLGTESDYRLRIGTYRVLFEVLDADRLVVVYRVRHRRDVYKG
jgi:mRNA interferase RelE/StbE